jgi:hypothetical protein
VSAPEVGSGQRELGQRQVLLPGVDVAVGEAALHHGAGQRHPLAGGLATAASGTRLGVAGRRWLLVIAGCGALVVGLCRTCGWY